MKEYKVVQTKRIPMEERMLNENAKDGWRLIAIVDYVIDLNRFFWYYLERDATEVLIKSDVTDGAEVGDNGRDWWEANKPQDSSA